MKMGWPPWGRVTRKALGEVPWEGTPGEIPPAAERPLGWLVYELWVDGAGGGPGKKIPRIPERGRVFPSQDAFSRWGTAGTPGSG